MSEVQAAGTHCALSESCGGTATQRGSCAQGRKRCPTLVPRSLWDRGGTLTSVIPVDSAVVAWLVNHVVCAKLHLHRDRQPPYPFTNLLRLGVREVQPHVTAAFVIIVWIEAIA